MFDHFVKRPKYSRKKEFSKSYKYFNHKIEEREYPNITKKYIDLLKVNWARPSVLSNEVIQKIPLRKFKYSEKLDGIHTFLLIYDKKVFNVTNNNDISRIYQINTFDLIDFKFSGDCIIETEYYENIYYIFDVYYLNGENYSKKFLDERLNSINKYLDDFGQSFKLKNFYEITDLKELIEYIKNDKNAEGNYIDGIILQRIDKPFFEEEGEPNSYKFKPSHLNTIDFFLKYNIKLNNFDLYLFGKYGQNLLQNLKKLPKDKYIYGLNDVSNPLRKKKNYFKYFDKILIYFDSPFYPNLGKLELTENWNKKDYSSNQINRINNLIQQMMRNPQNYHNTIVELSLTSDKKWVPYKLRKERFLPNSYRVGLSNISVIFDPIKPINTIYFQKHLTSNMKNLNTIHLINQTFRKYIIESYIGKYHYYNSSAIDLCGGRGADIFNLYSNGIANVFVIDNDTTALKRYFDRCFNIKNLEYKPLVRKEIYKPTWFNINFLNHKLGSNYEKIKEDLNSRYEFFKGRVNIVLLNFAIHYLCDDNEKIKKLAEFVQCVLFHDGIFIITYFDGDEILKKVKNNIANIGPFHIEIVKQENGVTIAKMPLPTIKGGDDIYAEEPLVQTKSIKILDDYFFKLDEFYVYDRCKNFIHEIQDYEEFIDYYRLIKVGVYYPNLG